MWVDIIAVIILCLSILGGLREGAVRQFFSLLIILIAIPLTGLFYYLIAALLAFLPGTNWENFIGFFITMVVISIILYFIFFIPRSFIQKAWKKGLLYRIFGGAFNVFNAAVSLTLFTLVLGAYPVLDFLLRAVAVSTVLTWLAENLRFVQEMLPEVFRYTPGFVPFQT